MHNRSHHNLTGCSLVNSFSPYKSKLKISAETIYDTSALLGDIDEFKFELISICLAIITMYMRYGSVFFFTNKTLSFLVTFIGFIAGVEQLMQLYSFRYISKEIEARNFYFLNIVAASGLARNVTLDSLERMLSLAPNQSWHFREASHLPDGEPILPGQIISSQFTLFFLYAVLSFFVYSSAIPCYAFAYLKYKERFLIEESLFVRSTSITSVTDKNQEKSTDKNGEKRKLNYYVSAVTMDLDNLASNLEENAITKPIEANSCCFNYCPHLIATIQLIVMCGCKLPFCYDFILYFNYYKDFGIMIAIIVEIIHTIILLFIWLSLTLRNDWDMHLTTSYSVCHWTYHLKLKENSTSKVKSK